MDNDDPSSNDNYNETFKKLMQTGHTQNLTIAIEIVSEIVRYGRMIRFFHVFCLLLKLFFKTKVTYVLHIEQ